MIAGTIFRNAHENVAEVYSRPRSKKYCVSVALKDMYMLKVLSNLLSQENNQQKLRYLGFYN